jgi:hypothetical protein
MKKIGTSVGSIMAKMNKKYFRPAEPVYFDAQHFLWNDEGNDALIVRTFGEQGGDVSNEIRQARRTLFRNIFSHEQQTAHSHIYRMFGRDFINAMTLRLDYDIEFAAGLLNHTPIHDIHELSRMMFRPVYPEAKACLKVERAQRILETVDRFLKINLPEVLDKPLDLRAARLGAMVNNHNVFHTMTENPAAATSLFRENIITSQRRYTKRICLLRQHYELARLQLISYASMVDELAEFNQNSESIETLTNPSERV